MSSQNSQSKTNPAILAQRHRDDANRYFERHGYGSLSALPPADPELALVIVIPALAEPTAVATLNSLAACTRSGSVVEVLLVINAADDATTEIRKSNTQCLSDAKDFAAKQSDPRFRCHILDYQDLPANHAGVGLARKLGMDTALARLSATLTGSGVIICLDADCTVDSNYLTAIENFFHEQQSAVGATVYFEHPVDDVNNPLLSAITEYELHLRCYKQGLQFAGSPYASHTVGSAVAVRSEIYAQEGGMNRRAAGEDFYFINKLLKRGQVGEINSTRVIPSARISKRVPFGTGAAMSRAGTESQTTYNPIVYQELQLLSAELECWAQDEIPVNSFYAPFLEIAGFEIWLSKTRQNVASQAALTTQLTRWLDGFRTMKFVNWLTETHYPRIPVAVAAAELLAWKNITPSDTSRNLLAQFRQLDRQTN